MKSITLSTAAAIFVGITSVSAYASGWNHDSHHERPDDITSVVAEHTVTTTAGNIYSTKELGRRGLAAGDSVTVTNFPSTGRIDPPSRDN